MIPSTISLSLMLNRFKIVVFISFIISSCHSQHDKNKKVIREWQGREIITPQKIEYKVFGKDALCPKLLDKPFKILTYVDSIGCSSCKMGLQQWKQLIDSCKIQHIDVSFLFIVHSSNFRYFTQELLIEDFDYPVIYDYENLFDKLNAFPKDPLFHTFLLNKENKVLLIGSPINNPNMWQLYKKTMVQSE